MFTTTMLRLPILPYLEIVTLLESYAERHNLDAQPAPQMVFYGRTKHIELDYHYVREKVALGSLETRFVSSTN